MGIPVNPTLAKGLKQLLKFTGDVEAVLLRSFQVSVQDIFGDIRTVDLKTDGGMIPVTKENWKEYVDLCVELFQPVELEQLICGSPELDFEALERNTLYEDGYRKDSRVIKDFWEVVHSLAEENKEKLLVFVTGCDRAPIKGLANLHFVISRNEMAEKEGWSGCDSDEGRACRSGYHFHSSVFLFPAVILKR